MSWKSRWSAICRERFSELEMFALNKLALKLKFSIASSPWLCCSVVQSPVEKILPKRNVTEPTKIKYNFLLPIILFCIEEGPKSWNSQLTCSSFHKWRITIITRLVVASFCPSSGFSRWGALVRFFRGLGVGRLLVGGLCFGGSEIGESSEATAGQVGFEGPLGKGGRQGAGGRRPEAFFLFRLQTCLQEGLMKGIRNLKLVCNKSIWTNHGFRSWSTLQVQPAKYSRGGQGTRNTRTGAGPGNLLEQFLSISSISKQILLPFHHK